MSRKHNADRRFQEGVQDFTAQPKKLEQFIAAGHCTGVVNFHTIEEPGKLPRMGMISGGMSQREIFDAVCIIRRSMMLMMNMNETPAFAEAMAEDLIADDEPVEPGSSEPAIRQERGGVAERQPRTAKTDARCNACGRDGWAILGRCEHQGCPKGLYKEG